MDQETMESKFQEHLFEIRVCEYIDESRFSTGFYLRENTLRKKRKIYHLENSINTAKERNSRGSSCDGLNDV